MFLTLGDWHIPKEFRRPARRLSSLAGGLALVLALAGCGASLAPVQSASGGFTLSPGATVIDTNCSGCNARTERGAAVQQFSARGAAGAPAQVTWTASGGDAVAGPGSIDTQGRYTPPSYLTADSVQVVVTAVSATDPRFIARTAVTVTPGFVAPLDPQNAAVGPGGIVRLTGRLAEAGGNAAIAFSVAEGAGLLSAPLCDRGEKTFTTCSVMYTAPAGLTGSKVTTILASAGASRTHAAVLLNEAGVASNPAAHQGNLGAQIPLGASGGNNADFDVNGNSVADCCSGTLGALVEDDAGRQYALSNNHVLARSDRASMGDPIVAPGLIDNNCTPYGDGPGTAPVAWLSEWLPLSAAGTNADAAIAEVGSRTVDASGRILELGARQANGELAAAAPGVSSTGGKGETAWLGMLVAKSGRTTGLTCAAVSAVDLDVSVDYFKDCAETRPYLEKTFTHQVAISGKRFSDAGDSGALAVDAANAEPVGLLFAGGVDAAGVSHAVANPAGDVLAELGAESGASLRFVGGADHPVSCLQYGEAPAQQIAAQKTALSDAQISAGRRAMAAAKEWADRMPDVLGVALGKSGDFAGRAAVIVYVSDAAADIPATIVGVRTVVIETTAQAVALGTAPLANGLANGDPQVAKASLARALEVKQQWSARLMRRPGIFGVGVGASLDDPREGALAIYVDRNRMPSQLPATVGGVRTRYVAMDRLHVTRSYLGASAACGRSTATSADPAALIESQREKLF